MPTPLIVIGLDGGTFDIIDPLIARGELPALAQLCKSGLRTELYSTVPPATLPAWTSFLTAEAPARHGVTDMFVHRGKSYALSPAHGGLRRSPTFLSRLSAKGLRVASLGVPGTYPPEPINGVLVAGFDAPGVSHASERSVHPSSFWPRLQANGGWRYATFNEHRTGVAHMRRAVSALLSDLDVKERIVLATHDSEPWDLFMVHLQASDTAAHHLWHTYDRGSPRYLGDDLTDALPSVYRRLDALIGRLLERARPDTRVLVVSDHGMGGASDVAVHLNRWLATRGHLHFLRAAGARAAAGKLLRRALGHAPTPVLGMALRHAPDRLRRMALVAARSQNVDYRRSAAFSDELDYAPAIWLNTPNQFEHGMVSREMAATIVDDLRAAVTTLRHPVTGEALIRAAHRRADLGFNEDSACPDLVLEPAWPEGYRPSFLPSHGHGPAVRILTCAEYSAGKGFGMPGVHRRAGIFLASGPGVPAMALPAFGIAEAGLLVYALLGLGAPTDIATRLPPHLAELAAGWASDEPVPTAASPTPSAYSAAEEAALSERLRALGYIE